MSAKSNIKIDKVKNRKMERVDKVEIKKWNNLFNLFGYKKDCYRQTGVAPETIKRVIKEGMGIQPVVESIRNYVAENA